MSTQPNNQVQFTNEAIVNVLDVGGLIILAGTSVNPEHEDFTHHLDRQQAFELAAIILDTLELVWHA